MKFHERQNPPPKSWEQFEDLCLDLYKRVWRDPRAKKHGRRGQKQFGVDVYGQEGGSGPFHGVQCKGKDGVYEEKVTVAELRAEVAKAKTFDPPLKTWTLATSGQADQAVQKVARELTEEHERLGLFSVHVAAWEDLLFEIKDHPEVIEVWFPEQAPSTIAMRASLERIEASTNPEALVKAVTDRLQQMFADPSGILTNGLVLTSSVAAASPQTTDDAVLEARIDEARDLIRAGHARAALSRLEVLETKHWSFANARARFRILANKGAALLQIGPEADAIDILFSAASQAPCEPRALSTKALAHILKGQLAQAREAAVSALSIDPINSDAAVFLIHTLASDPSISDPLAHLPGELSTQVDVVVAIARWYRQRGDSAGAQQRLELAVQQSPDNLAARAELGSDLLMGALDGSGAALGATSSKRQALHRAIEYLSAVWREVASDDRAHTYIDHAANLVAALRFAERPNDAQAILDEALRTAPKNAALLKHSARMLIEADRPKEALTKLEAVSDSDPEAMLLRAGALIESDHHQQGLALLDELVASSDDAPGRSAATLRPEVLLRLGRAEEAKAAARDLINKLPNTGDGQVALARVLHAEGDRAGAIEAARTGLRLIGPDENLNRLLLAMELYAAEEWDGAADALTSLVDPSVDSLPLRRRLGALFRADRRRDTTDLLDSLAPDVAAMPFYRRAAAVLAHRAGNWERVREHAEAYLRDVPDDLELRLIWIEAVEGLGDNATVTAFLDGPLMFPAASARHRMILAHALDRHGRGDRSLLLAYQTLRLHRADPDAHKGYFGLLFMGRAAPNAVPKPQTIGPDVAFEVKDDRGELRWYVIETATLPPLDPTRGEIGPVSALADRAFGLRVGDKVRISEAELQIDEREIVAIKHKYLHGLHRSIEDFNSVFPSDQALQKFHVDAARPESLKKTMLPALQARREHGEQIIERYKNDAWPIALMGAALGVGAIEAWHGLQEDAVEIRTCRGTGPERERALSRLSAKPSLAIDPLTLWIAEKLKVADALVQTFGLLGVAASTLTVFDELLQDRDGGRTRRAGVAFEVGGELVFRRETAADTKRAIRDLSEIRAAVRRHTVLIPTIPAREVSPVLRAVDGKLATNLTDPIFAASGADRVLLSDDERLRQIAVQEVSVPSVWLQAALMVARDVGSLDPTRYCDAVLALAASRHAFTSLDASTLLRAAARSGWSDAQRFRKIAASLGGATIDLRSALGVAAEFLRTLWTTNIGTTAQRRFTVAIVEVLCSGRDIATQAKMVEVLRRSGPSLSDFNAMKAFDAAMSSLTRA